MKHRIATTGPEGEQVHKDKTGKIVEGEGTVEYIGVQDEIVRLEVLAGERPPEDYVNLLQRKERARQQEKNFKFFMMFGGALKPTDA